MLLGLAGCATSIGRDPYIVYVPPELRGRSEPAPVVLVLHGGGGNAKSTPVTTQMNIAAQEHGFIAVYPSGTGKLILGRRFASWNGGYCCGTAADEGTNDVAYLRGVVREVLEQYNVNPERIYITGISNGGVMAQRMAQEAPDVFAAVAAIASPGPRPTWTVDTPVDMLIIHGTEDQCARFEGGDRCGGCADRAMGKEDASSFPCMGAQEQAAFWRDANQAALATEQVSFRQGDATCSEWTGEADVALCVLEGAGHTWPDGRITCKRGTALCDTLIDSVGEISRDLSNDQIWGFFDAHAGTAQ